jgi:hypothetical protein
MIVETNLFGSGFAGLGGGSLPMLSKQSLFALALLCRCGLCHASLTISDDGSGLTISEGERPVLVYNYEPVAPPAGVEQRYVRSCYIHPLYGLDGDVLTQDYPTDHFHHRGVFWAWPRNMVGEKAFNLWLIQGKGEVGARQHFEKWVKREEGDKQAEVVVENTWRYDDSPAPLVRETIGVVVHAAERDSRAIDFMLRFENVSQEVVTFLGADKEKGYGGFCIRPDASRKPLEFTTKDGRCATDVLRYDTPWADVSSRISPDGPYSGLAAFQHPSNPGYPHHGWIFRHYGFLGVSWPHLEPYILEPGKSVELSYRLFVHRGNAAEANVAKGFAEYYEAMK